MLKLLLVGIIGMGYCQAGLGDLIPGWEPEVVRNSVLPIQQAQVKVGVTCLQEGADDNSPVSCDVKPNEVTLLAVRKIAANGGDATEISYRSAIARIKVLQTKVVRYTTGNSERNSDEVLAWINGQGGLSAGPHFVLVDVAYFRLLANPYETNN